MGGRTNPEHQQILSANAALRQWSQGLQAWSRAARGASAAHRTNARPHLHPPGGSLLPAAWGDGLPPLDPIPVSELLQLLVHDHGFPVETAAHALAAGMLAAGYPTEYDRVGAADAFDLMQEIINGDR